MSVDMVREKMGGLGVKTLIQIPGRGETSAVDYPGASSDVYVEYDHRIDRRPRARAVRVRVSMSLSPATIETLVSRFGPPSVGAEDLVEGLHEGPAVWVDDACGVVLTAYRPTASWWAAEGGTTLQVETLELARNGDSPASSRLNGILARRNARPVASAPAVSEAVPAPPLTSEPIAAADGEDGVDGVGRSSPMPPSDHTVWDAIAANPPVLGTPRTTETEIDGMNGVEEDSPRPPHVAEDPVVVVPPAVAPAKPIITPPSHPGPRAWSVAAPSPGPKRERPAAPQTIATWRSPAPEVSSPSSVPKRNAPDAPLTIASWRPRASAASAPSSAPNQPASQPLRTTLRARTPLDRPAERVAYVPPVYPPTAKWLGVKGHVTLAIVVQADGTVASPPNVVAVHPTGRGFEEAAVDAVQKWRFSPATREGKPVESNLTIRVDIE